MFTPDESEEEPFNTAIDDTSGDPTIMANRLPLHSSQTMYMFQQRRVGCSQVTSQLQRFLNHFPPKSIEKAFEQIYQILQELDAYLIDNLQQH